MGNSNKNQGSKNNHSTPFEAPPRWYARPHVSLSPPPPRASPAFLPATPNNERVRRAQAGATVAGVIETFLSSTFKNKSWKKKKHHRAHCVSQTAPAPSRLLFLAAPRCVVSHCTMQYTTTSRPRQRRPDVYARALDLRAIRDDEYRIFERRLCSSKEKRLLQGKGAEGKEALEFSGQGRL